MTVLPAVPSATPRAEAGTAAGALEMAQRQQPALPVVVGSEGGADGSEDDDDGYETEEEMTEDEGSTARQPRRPARLPFCPSRPHHFVGARRTPKKWERAAKTRVQQALVEASPDHVIKANLRGFSKRDTSYRKDSSPRREVAPSSRKDAILLRDVFGQMKHEVGYDAERPHEKFRDMVDVFGTCFREACKQVRATCWERGELLQEIWDGFEQVYRTRYEFIDRLVEGRIIDNRLQCDCREAKEKAIQQCEQRVADARAAVQAKERDIIMLHQEIYTHKENFRVLRSESAQTNMYLRTMLAMKANRLNHVEALLTQLDEHTEMFRDDEELEEARTGNDLMAHWRAAVESIPQFAKAVLQSESFVGGRRPRMRDVGVQPTESTIGVTFAHAGVQVDKDEIHAVVLQLKRSMMQADDKSSLSAQTSLSGIWTHIISRWKVGQYKVWPKVQFFKFVKDAYSEKLLLDELDRKEHRPYQPMQEYIVQLQLNKYGVRSMVEKQLMNMLESIDKFSTTSLRARMFGRFLGLQSTYTSNDLVHYLNIVQMVHQSSCGPWYDENDIGVQKIALTRALDVSSKLFPSMSILDRHDFMRRVEDLMEDTAAVQPPLKIRNRVINLKGGEHKQVLIAEPFVVDMDRFLELCIKQTHTVLDSTEVLLRQFFSAADCQRDNVLRFPEFCAIARFASLGNGDDEIAAQYQEAIHLSTDNPNSDGVSEHGFVQAGCKFMYHTALIPECPIKDTSERDRAPAMYRFMDREWHNRTQGGVEHERRMLRGIGTKDAIERSDRLLNLSQGYMQHLQKKSDADLSWIARCLLLHDLHECRRWRSSKTTLKTGHMVSTPRLQISTADAGLQDDQSKEPRPPATARRAPRTPRTPRTPKAATMTM